MREKLQKIREEAMHRIEESKDLNKLNEARVAILGKKGELTAVLKGMKDVSPEDRPLVGQLVNETRAGIERMLEETKAKLEAAELEVRLKREVIDVTLPAKRNLSGHRHPNTIALEEVERIFTGMGYEVVEGPEVEYDYYNFEALNIPRNHPARDEQDTFYMIKFCSAPRHRRFRCARWRRGNCPSALLRRDGYSAQMRSTPHIPPPSIRLRAWSSTKISHLPI